MTISTNHNLDFGSHEKYDRNFAIVTMDIIPRSRVTLFECHLLGCGSKCTQRRRTVSCTCQNSDLARQCLNGLEYQIVFLVLFVDFFDHF